MKRARPARRKRDDSGQILVIVVILCSLLASLGPMMVSNLQDNGPLVLETANEHAALAAAEAGVEWYRNQLDSNANYFSYTAAKQSTPADPALSGWCSLTCDLGGTTPAESFHYTPNNSGVLSSTGTDAGELLLTVTGRAGENGVYDYVTVGASFERTSILDNSYFTNYEIIDPSYTFSAGGSSSQIATVTECPVADAPLSGTSCTCPNGSTCATTNVSITNLSVTYTYLDEGTGQTDTTTVELWKALCLYDSYQENVFVDSLDSVPVASNGNTVATNAAPYYGTYDQGQPFVFDLDASTAVVVPGDACGTAHTFVDNETFNGPVYSNDQLDIGGTPSFAGGSAIEPPYTSGAPSNLEYKWPVPDSVYVTATNSGLEGKYPAASIDHYAPKGTSITPGEDDGDDGATFANKTGPVLNGDEALPTFSTLDTYASSPTGCVYTGPTMIELVAPPGGGPTTMDVWSPLSSSKVTPIVAPNVAPNVAQATSSACSTGTAGQPTSFSTGATGAPAKSGPFITGIPLPSNGVVYVEDYAPNAGAADLTPASSCFNPLQNNSLYAPSSISAASCYEGDLFVGGEISGQLSIGSAANIVITRPITDACADAGSGASSADPSGIPACDAVGTDDVLGLDAATDVLLSNPLDGSDPTACTWDGTGAPSVGDVLTSTTPPTNATVPVLGAQVTEPVDIWPNCDDDYPISGTSNYGMVVDAAIVARNGALGTQNFDAGQGGREFFLNGADISEYRGSFGNGSIGYDKQFSYDSRLAYLEPPYLLASSVSVWKNLGYVACGNADTLNVAPPVCPTAP